MSAIWNLVNVTLLMPRILRWLLDFWKICRPLVLKMLLIIQHIQQSGTTSVPAVTDYWKSAVLCYFHNNLCKNSSYSKTRHLFNKDQLIVTSRSKQLISKSDKHELLFIGLYCDANCIKICSRCSRSE